LFVVARGLVFSPRFLLALVFPALLVAIETIRLLARRAQRRPRAAVAIQVVGVVMLCAALALPLRAYYRVPKQSYTAALALASSIRDGGTIVAVYTAQSGVHYYGVSHPSGERLVPGETVRVARTAAALERIMGRDDGRRLVLVTTFHRALRLGRPRLDALVRAGWEPAATFPASVGDGEITVWVPR
jgi:hypothetical protein